MTDPDFRPTRAAALARIAAVRPAAYARTRNALDGAVTRLSPYIAHGLVSLPEVLGGVARRGALPVQHKFVFELGWREYFHHVWQHRGDAILQSLHVGRMPEDAYARTVPQDVLRATTGVPAIDAAVRQLYATGWLHNHARMWLASYLVHVRHVHWRVGADWLWAHLLDGDLASNHLSWQWVAGTGSHKPYLFNADNVARYAPAAWHSAGSVIDVGYDVLDGWARGGRPDRVVAAEAPFGPGAVEPPCLSAHAPADLGCTAPQIDAVQSRDVWLVTPWSLGDPPADLPTDTLRLAVFAADWHRAWPMSPRRWAFIAERTAAIAPLRWWADAADIGAALRSARSVSLQAEPHARRALGAAFNQALGGAGPNPVDWRPSPCLFAPVDRACSSFSQWWTRTTTHARHLGDLPGLAGWLAAQPAGPLFETLVQETVDEGPHHEPQPADDPGARVDHRRPRWHRP